MGNKKSKPLWYDFLTTLLWGSGIACLILILWIAANGGCFFYYADYNYQQIPFYTMIHDSIQSGNPGWSYTTDLGANIVGSYSFYLLGSPFFWITLLFPSEAVPYLMAPLLMLKSGLAAAAAFLFLQRYVSDRRYAMIGGLLYAFSGIAVYNIIFNHFHEALIVFPLMMAAMDAFVLDKKRGFFVLTVFASALMNYYFFAGQAVFIFIYWCFRMVVRDYRMSIKEFLVLLTEIVIGVLCAGVILVPSILAVLQNDRLGIALSGTELFLYDSFDRYLHILTALFFPPDMPNYMNFSTDNDGMWSSIAAYIPMSGMTGVIAFYSLRKHRWLKWFLPVLLVFSFIPVLNSAFQLFNGTYYARWFYMPVLMMSLATVLSFDNEETKYKPSLIICFSVTAACSLLIGLLPKSLIDKNSHAVGLEQIPSRFWIWCIIALTGLGALSYLLWYRKKHKNWFPRLAGILSVIIVLYGNILIGAGVLDAAYKKGYIKDCTMDSKQAVHEQLKDINIVRSDFYYMMENTAMYWQIPSIQAFHSIVPGSVTSFYRSLGQERLVRSEPGTQLYGIRGLLSVKYLFDYNGHASKFISSTGETRMPGWHYLKTINSFNVYENDYYIPYGFTYREYITESQFEAADEHIRHLLLLKAVVLSDEQSERLSGILQHCQDISTKHYDAESYFADCLERRENCCEDVAFENDKITAHFTAGEKEELVFFSIPYESGWSAEVNGQSAVIEGVNEGFMAVIVPAGQRSEIIFRYHTPGSTEGVICSGMGTFLLIIYLVLIYLILPRKRQKQE